MSASTWCSQRAQALLERLRGWDDEPVLREVQALGEECPDEFFRCIVESLSDSFSTRDAKVYERLMQPWISTPGTRIHAQPPSNARIVYVLSRVTLGADIKITSVILDAARKRYPEAEIVFVAARKAAELYAADPHVQWLEANYPRLGSVESRLEFARRLQLNDGIVIDPDSRMTQLGLVLPCEPERYFHFPSRTYHAESDAALGSLASAWMEETFGVAGTAFLSPQPVAIQSPGPRAAVSLGVGENPAKRLGSDFEACLLREIAAASETVYIDRGAGGEERNRVDAAIRAADLTASPKVQFCEGSFAEFASIVSRCDSYTGYDSAGQHAAAAAGVPVTTIFAGAPNERFRMRWRPEGNGPIRVISAEGLSADDVMRRYTSGR